jgi:hypothetical protein
MIIVIVVAIVSVVSTAVAPFRAAVVSIAVVSIAVISAIVIREVAVVIVLVEPSVILVRSHFLESTTIVVVVAVVAPIVEHHNPPSTLPPSMIVPRSRTAPILYENPPRPGGMTNSDRGSYRPTVNTDIGRHSLRVGGGYRPNCQRNR